MGFMRSRRTFGLKLLLWYAEVQRNLVRFDAAAEECGWESFQGPWGRLGT